MAPPYRDFELLAAVRCRTVTGQRDSCALFSHFMCIRRQARVPTVIRSRQLRPLTHLLSFGHLDYGSHSATLPKQVLVLLVLANFQSAKDPILSVGCPVDLEQTLWDAADKLRGNQEPSEYKHVVLGLVFLKYVSDRFEERRRALEILPSPRNRCVEDAGRDVLFVSFVITTFTESNSRVLLGFGFAARRAMLLGLLRAAGRVLSCALGRVLRYRRPLTLVAGRAGCDAERGGRDGEPDGSTERHDLPQSSHDRRLS